LTATLTREHGHEDDGNKVALNITYNDTTAEVHTLLVNWGDGIYDTINLGLAAGGTFTQRHVYHGFQGEHDSGSRSSNIVATVLDDERRFPQGGN
jgi:hypothetical protein